MSAPAEAMTIRVGIIEDQAEVREGLALLINDSAGLSCVGAWRSMEEGLAAMDGAHPHVALVDIGLPGMSGIEGVQLLKQRYPKLQLLILTVYGDDDRIFAAICAGACGYLLKKTPPERLIESLREVAGGGAPMSPEVARRVMELFRRFRPVEQASYRLTQQEIKLLKLLASGHHYKTAAAELDISVHTVAFHLRSIYDKLQVHSKSEAVAKALREGLIR
ncbi:MAG TPA: response regulator transcription factor [Bryobacteraceae bacterium]|nr:response regulator transcription factor [Bryobacteraceae bacterium]